MIELLKTNGEKLRPFSESSRLYTVREKKNDPYIDPFLDSDLSFPDPPHETSFVHSITRRRLQIKAQAQAADFYTPNQFSETIVLKKGLQRSHCKLFQSPVPNQCSDQ